MTTATTKSSCLEWNNPIVFTLYGELKGKGRPRFTRNGHIYTPEATKKYEEQIFRAYTRVSSEITNNPVRIEIYAFKHIPKSTTKKEIALIKAGKLLPTQKPDADNIAKIILDALNGVAYKDDKQVVEQRVVKRYTESEERVTVMIYTLK